MIHYAIPHAKQNQNLDTACGKQVTRSEASALASFVNGCPACERAAEDGPDLAYVIWALQRRGWGRQRSELVTHVSRWTRSIADVRVAVESSRTLAEAGIKLGVTKARVRALCDARGVDWHLEKRR